MNRLTRIEARANTAIGEFVGSFEFKTGLNVVSAPNSFGKTIAATSMAWCIGLEPMYGVQRGDQAIFPEAMTEGLVWSGPDRVPVHASSVSVHIETEAGNTLRLSRAVVGGDPGIVSFEHENDRGSLLVGSMKNVAAGLQHHLFQWAALPEAPVLTRTGGESFLYWENIGPLFFIEQLEGWRDVQAQQVYRYQQLEIAEIAVEYLLGLDTLRHERIARQTREIRESQWRSEGQALIDQANDLVVSQGWEGKLTSKRDLESLRELLSSFELRSYLLKEYAWSYEKEKSQRERQRKEILKKLNDLKFDNDDRRLPKRSSTAISLKRRLHTNQEALRELRTELVSQRKLATSIEGRIQSAKDLLRLKRDKIGVDVRTECPTCHRDLTLADFAVLSQTEIQIEAHISAIEADRKAIQRSIDSTEMETKRLLAQLQQDEDEYRAAAARVEMMVETKGAEREALVDIAAEVTKVERELDLNAALNKRVTELDDAIRLWISSVAVTTPADTSAAETERGVLRSFEVALRRWLLALGHEGVSAEHIEDVRLIDYVPFLAHRRLRSQGSASDSARLVMAYVLALHQTAAAFGGAHHPGFLVLDEPLQQNPDPEHRKLFVDGLAKNAKDIQGQVLIFTVLDDGELATLRNAGVNVIQPEGAHFLQPALTPA